MDTCGKLVVKEYFFLFEQSYFNSTEAKKNITIYNLLFL